MEITLPKPEISHTVALPVHEPMGTTRLWFHCSSFYISVHVFVFFPILLNLLVEKASSYWGL